MQRDTIKPPTQNAVFPSQDVSFYHSGKHMCRITLSLVFSVTPSAHGIFFVNYESGL